MYQNTAIATDLSSKKPNTNSFLFILTRESFRFINLICYRRIKIHGQENLTKLPKDKGVIIIANHVHKMDPWLIATAYRIAPIHFLAKKELTEFFTQYHECLVELVENEGKKPLVIHMIKACGLALVTNLTVKYSLTLPVDRDNSRNHINKDSLEIAHDLLCQNRTIGIFPEGGIGRKSQISKSPLRLAKGSNSVILPMFISPRPSKWNKDDVWTITIGKPFNADGHNANTMMQEVYRLKP